MNDELTLDQLREWLADHRDRQAERARYHRENYVPHRCDAAWHQAQSSLAELIVTCIDKNRLPNDDDVRLYPVSDETE